MQDSPLAASAAARPRALAAERVLHHLRPLVAVIDKTGVFVDAWGAHGAFLGYRPEGLIGRQSLDLVVPREQEMVASIFQQAAERQDFSVDMPVPFQLTLVAASGATALVDVSAVAVRDGSAFEGWVVSFVPHSTRSTPTGALEALLRGGAVDEVLERCADALVGDRTDSRHLVGCVLSQPVHGRFTRLHGSTVSSALRDAMHQQMHLSSAPWAEVESRTVALFGLDELPMALADAARAEKFEALVAVPIDVDGTRAAALVGFIAPHRRPLPGFVRQLFDHLADITALALSHQWSNDDLRRAARRDGLTGVANRTGFDEQMMTCDPALITVLYIDLDEFKAINDVHGHECGDRVLVEVARRLVSVSGPTDLVARLGGDEFALVHFGVDIEAAREIGEQVVVAVGQPLPDDCGADKVTVSVGVAVGSEHARPREVLSAADRALLGAKRSGRNRVQVSL